MKSGGTFAKVGGKEKVPQKFWRMKIGEFFSEKVKLGKIFHGVLKFKKNSEIGGNVKQGGNASLPKGDGRPWMWKVGGSTLFE